MIVLGMATLSVVGTLAYMVYNPKGFFEAATGVLADPKQDDYGTDWSNDPWRVALRLLNSPNAQQYMAEQFPPFSASKKLFAQQKPKEVEQLEVEEVTSRDFSAQDMNSSTSSSPFAMFSKAGDIYYPVKPVDDERSVADFGMK